MKQRVKMEGEAVYHCVSRANGGLFLFDPLAKERLRETLWRAAEFCGVHVLAYTILTNHFHVLVRIPEGPQPPLDDEEILRRVRFMFGQRHCDRVTALFSQSDDPALRERFTRRMRDLSNFLKLLKQSYSIWFNKERDRFGTLWAERFSSTLVENGSQALRIVAAYVDLNPVRAGLCTDPKDYRYCSYAEAVAGHAGARRGLEEVMATGDWKTTAAAYRCLLFGAAGKPRRGDGTDQATIDRNRILDVFSANGELSLHELLKCRVRYFSDGLVFGSTSFLEQVFQINRSFFGPRRKSAARRMRGGAGWGAMRTVRDLKVDPLS